MKANSFNELFRNAFVTAMQGEEAKKAGQTEAYDLGERIFNTYCESGQVTMVERAKKLDEEVHELGVEGKRLAMYAINTYNAMQSNSLPADIIKDMQDNDAACALTYLQELGDVLSIALGEVSRVSHATGYPFGMCLRIICGLNEYKHEQRDNGNGGYGHTHISSIDDLPFDDEKKGYLERRIEDNPTVFEIK